MKHKITFRTELTFMVAKVRRFKSILEALRSRPVRRTVEQIEYSAAA